VFVNAYGMRSAPVASTSPCPDAAKHPFILEVLMDAIMSCSDPQVTPPSVDTLKHWCNVVVLAVVVVLSELAYDTPTGAIA